jgi:hypothetical protein
VAFSYGKPVFKPFARPFSPLGGKDKNHLTHLIRRIKRLTRTDKFPTVNLCVPVEKGISIPRYPTPNVLHPKIHASRITHYALRVWLRQAIKGHKVTSFRRASRGLYRAFFIFTHYARRITQDEN